MRAMPAVAGMPCATRGRPGRGKEARINPTGGVHEQAHDCTYKAGPVAAAPRLHLTALKRPSSNPLLASSPCCPCCRPSPPPPARGRPHTHLTPCLATSQPSASPMLSSLGLMRRKTHYTHCRWHGWLVGWLVSRLVGGVVLPRWACSAARCTWHGRLVDESRLARR